MFSASRAPPTRSPPDGSRGRGALRGVRLTSWLGLVLLGGLPVVMATGLLSNAAYDPRLDGNVALQGRPANREGNPRRLLVLRLPRGV